MLRFLTAGESHGRALVVIVEGLPAGLAISREEIAAELARRRLGFGRGPRMRLEQDELTLVAGVRHGRTLGSPVAIEIANTEWPKWEKEMDPGPGTTARALTQPRPGHADLAGMQKYGFTDARDVLERASARETAARVAAGACAKALLARLGVSVLSHVVQLGPICARPGLRPGPEDLARVDGSPVRCLDPEAEAAMVAEVEAAAKAGDSLGGVAEVLAHGVPVGLGSHVHWDRKLDGLLAQALMSIQAVKGVALGDGFEVAGRRGSEAHDEILWDAAAGRYRRGSSRAGGIEGGMSTGELLVARVAMKPLATLNRPVLRTVDTETKEQTVSFKERTDVTAVPAMGVVAETMVALVLAAEALRKFGGDSIEELVRNRDGFLASLAPEAGAAEPAASPRGGPHVALVGMMGSGKTTVGSALASCLGRPFLDSDRQVEARAGRTVADIWRSDGEPAFRRLEAEALADALAGAEPAVVAAAGGVVLDPANRRLLRDRARVVWLRARPETLTERTPGGAHRPLLDHEAAPVLRRLAEEREPLYRELADVVVDVDGLDVAEVVDRILEAIG